MERADKRPSVAATEPRKVEIVRGENPKKSWTPNIHHFCPIRIGIQNQYPCANATEDRDIGALLS
jgi:hypothetical protein